MKAFWTVRGAEQNGGGWQPSFPETFQYAYLLNYGDLRVFGPDEAPADHKHAQMGCLALGTNHYHWMIFDEGGESWHQDYVGNVANEHEHDIPVNRTHFFCFVICSDAEYTQLLIDAPNIIVCGLAPVTETGDGWTIGPIDNTEWDAGTRTDWENKFSNFGLSLPEKIMHDRRLVQWILAIFFNEQQNMRTDETYRYLYVTGLSE
jgi:hypothetical protein